MDLVAECGLEAKVSYPGYAVIIVIFHRDFVADVWQELKNYEVLPRICNRNEHSDNFWQELKNGSSLYQGGAGPRIQFFMAKI